MERRLAAIFAADMVGYSRLMEADEVGTLERQKVHRNEVMDPAFELFHGHIFKEMGDGLLVEFSSVVSAVQCAVAIQSAMPDREAQRPDDQRIRYRIGINLGDIVADGGDMFGDGVNVAARLEQIAEPGGICISGTAYDHMHSVAGLAIESLGEVRVKNLERPIRAFKVVIDANRAGTPAAASVTGKPSLAVLPFANMSEDPEQEYFADGIAEDLIVTLGRCRWLRVTARNSTFAYKGQSPDIRSVARDLGVRYVLQGSIRRSGDRIRVAMQLSDGKDGSNLLGERYDRQLVDVFDLQEEIALLIAGTIEPELSEIEGSALRGRATADLGAWECYQKGLWHLYRFTNEDLAVAKGLFEQAVELDAGFSQAHARLAYVYVQLAWYGPLEDRSKKVEIAERIASHAVTLDSKDPSARLSLGRALTLSGRFEEGVEQLRMATSLDPSFAQAHFALGQALTSLDRYEEAIQEMNVSIQLSPRDPHLWTFYHVRAIANYIGGNLEQAEVDEHNALRQANVTFYPWTVLIAILGRQGKMEEAREAVKKLHEIRPDFSLTVAIDEWHFGSRAIMTPRFMEQFADDFRKAMPDE